MASLPISFFLLSLIFSGIAGHGRLMDPPNRSSLWRVNPEAPPNYIDDQNNCGGKTTPWEEFDGKCGVCGDQYDAPHPQDNENTGAYGRGLEVSSISKFFSLQIIWDFLILDPNAPESREDCFVPLTLEDGSSKYVLENKQEQGATTIDTTVKLPDGLTCERCVNRWHYNTGNYWDECDDAGGCGPQETFRSCADIVIN